MSEQLEIDVQNVKCGGCASAIKEGLTPLPGVDSVEVDIDSGHVSIRGRDLPEDAILDKLFVLGFPAK